MTARCGQCLQSSPTGFNIYDISINQKISKFLCTFESSDEEKLRTKCRLLAVDIDICEDFASYRFYYLALVLFSLTSDRMLQLCSFINMLIVRLNYRTKPKRYNVSAKLSLSTLISFSRMKLPMNSNKVMLLCKPHSRFDLLYTCIKVYCIVSLSFLIITYIAFPILWKFNEPIIISNK